MLNRITVQLPVEGLLFWNMSGREALSESFALTVTLLGTDARIDRSKLLGQPITVTIPTQNLMSNRYINGKVTRVAVSAVELTGTRYAVYTLTVESDLWPMKRDKNLRIFQGQTVPQIVKTLLGEYQVNIEDKLTGSYRVWDYCVQYQESSFDFISRLMELEGITYHFQHQSDSHTMVLTDAATQHQPFAGYEVIPYHQTPSGGSTDEEGIGQWALEDNVTPGIYSLDDYDFRKPNAWMFQARQNPSSPVPGSIDVYDWPGRFVEHGHGEFYARIHQERWQVEHQLIHGTATAIGVAPGNTFALTNAPFFSDNGEYLTTEATYYFEENRYSSGNDGETVHRVDFTVIPSNIPFRPLQTTQWPRTYGPQTAKVVGPKGESIWTDKYGRVKVKFHWDRLAKGDDTSSCWVRVSSAWAGQGFGGVQVPRVGDEVVIDFINGDPDRPIITGRVYNEASMPPWALPAAATQMGFLSRSKDGSTDSANALRFEDRAGEEHVWIQAQRNMDVNVKNDASQSIGSNNSHYVRKNEVYRVEENQAQAVKGGTEILTGQGKLDAVVGKFVIASGEQLRLVSGESAIELNANGQINLVGKGFNFFVENEGFITTGGKLHLNTAGTEPGTSAPGSTHQKDIKAAVQEKFTPGKPSKAGAPAQKAPAAAAPKPVAEFKNAPASSGDKISNYDYSLQDMVDKQKNLKAKPQKWSRTGFVNASEDDIKKYTNPDNFNSGDAKYQFLDLSASSGISEDDMGSFLKGKGVLEGQQKAYLDAAQKYNVSEVYLASHSALETGNGASALAKGVEVHGVKVYNMYGIGALDGNAEKTGANYAYKMGWTSPEKAIDGGAKWISEKYINNADYAQNNLYKMRWNPASPGTHQYATDVNWASAQTANMKKLFDNFPRAKLSYDIPKFK